jgi:hypothetical protein
MKPPLLAVLTVPVMWANPVPSASCPNRKPPRDTPPITPSVMNRQWVAMSSVMLNVRGSLAIAFPSCSVPPGAMTLITARNAISANLASRQQAGGEGAFLFMGMRWEDGVLL